MIKILFVCFGNICRSPMAEFIFKDIVIKNHAEDRFFIESAATSNDNVWNGKGAPVYQPAKRELAKHGITCENKRARKMTRDDYGRYDYIIGMETMNIRDIGRITGGDPEGKVFRLLDFTDAPGNIDDPWYTDDYETAYADILRGCEGLYREISVRELSENKPR